MTLSLTLPDDLAAELTRTAQATGKTPEQIAISAIQRDLASFTRLDELMTPVHDLLAVSGMTDEEALQLFEAGKHEMRRQRAAVK